jgi:hypothetical protein
MMSKAKTKETKGHALSIKTRRDVLGWMWFYNCGPDDLARTLFAELRFIWGWDYVTTSFRPGRSFRAKAIMEAFFSPSRPRRQKMKITQEGNQGRNLFSCGGEPFLVWVHLV